MSAGGRDLGASAGGVVAVLLNVAAVVFLQSVPHAYQPLEVNQWLAEVMASPSATMGSAWSFTIGLGAMVPFAVGLHSRFSNRMVTAGASLIAVGALLNAAGTLAPIAALRVGSDVGHAMLQLTLLLDSAFNFFLGVGILMITIGARHQLPKVLVGLGVLAGVACLPVTFEFVSAGAARFLLVAGPLWLVWVTWLSVRLARNE